jgi:hypothetical protein
MQREGKMTNTTTIYVSADALGISAKNKNFPRVSDIMALRMQRQADFNIKGLRVAPSGGFATRKVPVLGRCPLVQL